MLIILLFGNQQVRFYDLHITNTNMSTQLSLVYQELQKILERCFWGISFSCLSVLENSYQKMCNRPLEYQSLGVSNIKDLLVNMCNIGMLVFFEERESKEKYVMAANIVEFRRKVLLKREVEALLYRRGEILFSSFDDAFKDEFKENFDYHFYGLSGLEDLCENLKDTVAVREVNRSGAKVKVIRAVEFQVYNSRKRKKSKMNE